MLTWSLISDLSRSMLPRCSGYAALNSSVKNAWQQHIKFFPL